MKKINKNKARLLYYKGVDILIIPCKANPHSIWYRDDIFNINDYNYMPFDVLVDRITYYNCDYECGYYCAYYVKEDLYNE